MARPPKPTALHVLEGTFRPKRHAKRIKGERKPLAGKLTPPAWLRAEALEVWREIVPPLEAAGVVGADDRQGLANYCTNAGVVAALSADPDLYADPGKLRALNAATSAVLRWSVEYGLTASARARLAVPAKQEGEADPMSAVLG